MSKKLLFPNDYFDKSKVSSSFVEEYEAAKLAGFECYLFDEELFSDKKIVKVNCNFDMPQDFIYRGWMMKYKDYEKFRQLLISKHNIVLINNIYEYISAHHFDFAYIYFEELTPKIFDSILGSMSDYFDSKLHKRFDDIKTLFSNTGYFMMKDNVKSLKDDNFPKKISCNVTREELYYLVGEFIKLRGSLYTGGIILKEFVNLKKYDDTTNEYRIFFSKHDIISISRNSNQDINTNTPPLDFIDKLYSDKTKFPCMSFSSNFYTVDVAELEDGTWTVLECGDGQVSGLSPNQNYIEFYQKLKEII